MPQGVGLAMSRADQRSVGREEDGNGPERSYASLRSDEP
jgi:hypothetical protein